MNILFIPASDPRRVDFGGAQRSHLMWKALQEVGTVYTVVAVGRRCHPKRDEGARFHEVSLRSPWYSVWFLQVALFRFLNGMTLPFRSRKFIRSRIGWEGVDFDCVVARYVQGASNFCAWKLAPACYVDVDDWPLESYAAICGNRHSWLRRFFSRWAISVWTRHVLRRCKGAWVANRLQIPMVSKFCPCGFLPNLAMPRPVGYHMNGRQKRQLMTVGIMSHPPNWRGVDWFLKDIWPGIRRCFPDLTYMIAGGEVSDSLRAAWMAVPGVRVLGFVDDLGRLYEESLAVVTPIQSGAGTCIKVLEGVVYGRKVFSTAVGLRGFDPKDVDAAHICSFEDFQTFYDGFSRWAEASAERRAEVQEGIAAMGAALHSFERFAAMVRLPLVRGGG